MLNQSVYYIILSSEHCAAVKKCKQTPTHEGWLSPIDTQLALVGEHLAVVREIRVVVMGFCPGWFLEYPGCFVEYPGCFMGYPGCFMGYPGCFMGYPGCFVGYSCHE